MAEAPAGPVGKIDFPDEEAPSGPQPLSQEAVPDAEPESAGVPEQPLTEDAVPALWNVGDVILSLFDVKKVHEGGGMGLVYRVRHRGWNIDLAVKSPRPEFFRNDRDKENFEREAETWVKLGLHPHIVSCYYVRRLGGIPRIFAEYVEGGSLKDWIEEGKLYEGGPKLALERLLDVAIQFAWGLHHAHEEGLVHQDVKPANVMMTPDGVAKVTDFGLAKARASSGKAETPGKSNLVSTGGMTPAYCSPEQAQGAKLTRKSDVWSWAVSVLEMFAGEVTWRVGHVAGEALESFLETGSGDERLGTMPPELAELLRQCFQLDPDQRPEDMVRVAAQLQEIYRRTAGRDYHRPRPEPAKALADSLNNRAVSLLDLGRKPEAGKLWEQALQADPQHLESTYNRGLVRWRAGDISHDELLHSLQQAGRRSPGAWLPFYLTAWVHLERGDCHAAIPLLQEASRVSGDAVEVRTSLTQAKELEDSLGCLRTFEGHKEGVDCACFSPDGQWALSGSRDGVIKLWAAPSGALVRTFKGQGASVSFDPEGRFALSGSRDGTLKLWEVESGECLRTFRGHTEKVNSVHFHPNGNFALSGSSDKTLKQWEAESGRCFRTFKGHTGSVTSLSISSDGQCVLSGSDDKTLKLWEIANGRCLQSFKGHADRVNAVSLDPDGGHALSGSDDKTLKLWSLSSGDSLRTCTGHTGRVVSVCFSPDSRQALSGSEDGTLKLWEIASGRCLRTYQGHANVVTAVCFSPDGQHALSSSWDDTLKMWKVSKSAGREAPVVVSRVSSVGEMVSAGSAHEQALAAASQKLAGGEPLAAARLVREARVQAGFERDSRSLQLWAELYLCLRRKNIHNDWKVRAFEGHTGAVKSVSLSPDGRLALSGSSDHTLKLWEVESGRCLRTFEGHKEGVNSVSFSDDGRFALSAGQDHTLKLWEVESGRCLRSFHGHTFNVSSACFSPDGLYVLSASWDCTVKLWDVVGDRCLRSMEGHKNLVNCLDISPDGRFAMSGSVDQSLKLWEIATGACLLTISTEGEKFNCVSFSPDGRYALSGSEHNIARLWEVAENGSCRRTFHGHAGKVNSACLSPDSCFALTGSDDKTVKLWKVAGGQCLRTFQGHAGGVTSACFSHDARHALSGSEDGALVLWYLDWELEENEPADWDEEARPYLRSFLTLHTPYEASLPEHRQPRDGEITQALSRGGPAEWTEEDFQKQLLHHLGRAGFGWLRPKGVRRELEKMAARLPKRRQRHWWQFWKGRRPPTVLAAAPKFQPAETTPTPDAAAEPSSPVQQFLVKCPRCDVTIVRDQPCPNCRYSANELDLQKERAFVEEFERRKLRQQSNFALFIGLMSGAGAVGVLFAYLLIRYLYIGRWSEDWLLWFVFGPIFITTVILLVGSVLLGTALWFSRKCLSYKLTCPSCNVRLDDEELRDGRCPGCDAMLQDVGNRSP